MSIYYYNWRDHESRNFRKLAVEINVSVELVLIIFLINLIH